MRMTIIIYWYYYDGQGVEDFGGCRETREYGDCCSVIRLFIWLLAL